MLALGNGLNLGPIIDPKVNLATGGGNNFAAQQQPQQFQQSVDPVTGLLTGLPLAGGLAQGLDLGGLTNGLPLNTATGLLNNLPLGQVIQTAQGAVPLGAVLGAAGGLTNGLPLGGQNGRNPLAALQGIVGGQSFFPFASRQLLNCSFAQPTVRLTTLALLYKVFWAAVLAKLAICKLKPNKLLSPFVKQ